MRRIADAIAPEPPVEVESPAVPERLDSVTVRTRDASLEISWASREALLRVIRHLDWAKPVLAAFDAVGATRPVELDKLDAAVLAQLAGAIDSMGTSDGVPAGLVELRKALSYPAKGS